MSAYLDRLTTDFDTITAGIDEILNRAAEENRDATPEETQAIERDQTRADKLQADIDRYGAMEVTRAKVNAVRAKVPQTPQVQRTIQDREPVDPQKVLREAFPTLGDYMVTVSRALAGDQEAAQVIERATADQTTADNPGLIPRPILGPVVNLIDSTRPFIQSISNRPLPASGSFDRPKISQHVAIGKQAAEKTETASRKMIIDKLPVAPDTFAGHVDISRQDIRRTTPGIMQIIAEDFAVQYALETDASAVADFVASVTGAPIMVVSYAAADISRAIFEAAGVALSAHQSLALPDTLWVSTDVWGGLGGVYSPNGAPIFPSLTPESTTGNVLGLKVVVDPYFPVNTSILGSSRLAEWYEDVDGLLQVADVPLYGTTVGYAGDGAFLNTAPETFIPLTFPIQALAESASSKSSK
jgi:HK97 family phage major capsid protein